MLIPLLLGLLHAAVDAATVSVTMRAAATGPAPAGAALALILGYDLIAFAGQVPLGWLTDRFWNPRGALILGVALTVLSISLTRLGLPVMVAAAGLGNALFHLGAGSMILRDGLERAAPVGVFVAPGALGLGFGMAYGPEAGALGMLAIPVVLLLVLFWLVESNLAKRPQPRPSARAPLLPASVPNEAERRPRLSHIPSVLALLLVSVFVRSLVGSYATHGYDASDLLLFGVPLVACLGKGLGGIVADRFGWLETTSLALLLALPLIAFAPPTPLLLLGLFLLQMTMPVTLTAAARLMPHRTATAFGLTCLALVCGMLPKALPAWSFVGQRPWLAGWVLLGLLTLHQALRRLGFDDSRFRVLPFRAKERTVL